MKTPSTELFMLIHSLSRSEKRSFKLSSGFHRKEKQYVKLFDIIEGQKSYDERAAQEKFGFRGNDFAVKKKHLHALILGRMAGLHAGKEADLQRNMVKADFLYTKGLYAQEKKVLHRAGQLALQTASDHYLLEILNKQYWLAWKDLNMPEAKRWLNERKKLITRIVNENEYRQLEGKLTMLFAELGNARGTSERTILRKAMQHPLLISQNSAVSFHSLQSFYNIHCSYNVVIGEKGKALLFAKKMVGMYRSSPEKVRYKTVSYLIALNNLIHLCNELKRHEEEKEYLDLLEESASRLTAAHEKAWAFYTYHLGRLSYYARAGKFKEAIPVLELLHKELPAKGDKLDELQQVALYLKMAGSWFQAGHYGKCIQILNKLLERAEILRLRPDLKCTAEMLFLTAHFEKKNFALLSSLARSKYQKHLLTRRSYRLEGILLRFFISCPKLKGDGGRSNEVGKNDRALEAAFTGLKNELMALLPDQFESAPLQPFDFITWADEKIK